MGDNTLYQYLKYYIKKGEYGFIGKVETFVLEISYKLHINI